MLFPQHTWVSDSVLHFYRQEYFEAGPPDRLEVVNRTSKEVKYLRINSVDLFILFSMQPSSLNASPPRGDSRWLSVTGEFADGRPIKDNSASFLLPNGGNGPFTYYLFITDGGAVIENSQLKKY